MKTPILRKYESKLIEVNDQLCYFLFSDYEFEANLSERTNGSEDKFTTDIFSENEFSGRLHIKVEDLPSFREKAFHTLVGMSLITSVEYMLNYIEEIENYRSEVSPSTHDSITDEKPEEQLKKKMNCWLGKDMENAIIKTVKYLRLRRNHIAHAREEMSQGYSSLIKNDSHLLNNYWGAKSTKLYNFNFSKKEYSLFSVNEIFALINLNRVCMRIIDEAIVPTLSIAEISQYEISKFLENKAINGLTITKKTNKFRAYLKRKYGASVPCSEDDYILYSANA